MPATSPKRKGSRRERHVVPSGKPRAGEAGSGGSGRRPTPKPPVKVPKAKGRGESYAIMRRSKTNAEKEKAKGSGDTLREKIARVEKDKSTSRDQKDRMIKSLKQRHSKSAAEG